MIDSLRNFRAIVLAAGRGVRMNSEHPKVLHQVCGKPMVGHVLDVLKSLGFSKPLVVVGHKGNEVKRHLDHNVETVFQKKLLGTADAIRSAQNHFRNYTGSVLILCADTPLLKQETVRALVRKHGSSKASCTFLTAQVDNPRGYGRVIRGGSGHVAAIHEDKDLAPNERRLREINVGTYCFKARDLFNAVEKIKVNRKKNEFYLTDIIDLLVSEKKCVETLTTDDASEGLGINTREDLSVAEDILRKRILKKLMRQGVTVVDPNTTFIAGDARIGRDTTIYPFAVIEHSVSIGSKCSIGPFCHLRPKTKIGNGVSVGNFTEISRSTLGSESFMKHFSFLGDAVVGRNVNIGAGAVTANFDGKKKNVTRISDGAFIGSDSILIAPVKIGKKATIAAGCVVTKGMKIPEKSLAMGVPARLTSRRK